jgi:tripartite-type tricarboxylate transporter receptor subunit TctC
VIDRLAREVAASVADAEVQKKLRELNIDPRSSTPEQTTALLVNDIQRWSRVIERSGIPRQ